MLLIGVLLTILSNTTKFIFKDEELASLMAVVISAFSTGILITVMVYTFTS